MACSRSLIIEDNFLCSICLSVFNKPVSIPCGHNFCLDCISNYWETTKTFPCPLCKEALYTKPVLRVNSVIAEIAERITKKVEEKSDSTSEQTGNGSVPCGICRSEKAAIKSCLVCFNSFCEEHLERHRTVSTLKKHKLIDPVENLENRICKVHDEPLEYYCRVDSAFICEDCKKDHKNHEIVPLEEEAQLRKTLLGNEKTNTDKMIQAHQQKIQETQNSVEASRKNAAKACSCNLNAMTALVDYIKKSQAELTEVIETKLKKCETEAEGFIKELEGEIMQIKQKNEELNQVSLANDPFIFLENFLSFTIPQPEVKDWSGVTLTSEEFLVQGALAKLETTVKREVSMLCDPDMKGKQRHAVDVTLDPDTANPKLTISADGKQVTIEDRKRNIENKPERFDNVLNVLAKEGFSSGKFYYEVQVKGKPQWDLGVAYGCINRKGDIRLSPKNGYWTIWLRNGNELTANTVPPIHLTVRQSPEKVGVFVDYKEGQVSFYDVDARANIYSFTGCNFTEKLFPFFSPCNNDEGKNSAPMIITPVKYKS